MFEKKFGNLAVLVCYAAEIAQYVKNSSLDSTFQVEPYGFVLNFYKEDEVA